MLESSIILLTELCRTRSTENSIRDTSNKYSDLSYTLLLSGIPGVTIRGQGRRGQCLVETIYFLWFSQYDFSYLKLRSVGPNLESGWRINRTLEPFKGIGQVSDKDTEIESLTTQWHYLFTVEIPLTNHFWDYVSSEVGIKTINNRRKTTRFTIQHS